MKSARSELKPIEGGDADYRPGHGELGKLRLQRQEGVPM